MEVENEDSKISLEEFEVICEALFQDSEGSPYPLDEDKIKEAFSVFDKSNDGFIDRNEFDLCWSQWIKVIIEPVSALLVVDVQNDFISGSLPFANTGIKENNVVVTPINKLLDTVTFHAVAYSLDWHPKNHISFIDNVKLRKLHSTSPVTADEASTYGKVIFAGPPVMEQILWPPHAVQNTWGAELHKDLKVVDGAIKIYKATDPEMDSHSAFWDNLRRNQTNLSEELNSRNITDLYVCGLAYDYCVGSSCLDSLKEGFRTCVVDECTAGIEAGTTGKMKDAILNEGGLIVKSEEVLSMVKGEDRKPELGYKLAMNLKK